MYTWHVLGTWYMRMHSDGVEGAHQIDSRGDKYRSAIDG